MIPTRLYTRDGRDVGVTIQMPPFQAIPGGRAEGIMWGSRCFFWSERDQQYREGLLWMAPQDSWKIDE